MIPSTRLVALVRAFLFELVDQTTGRVIGRWGPGTDLENALPGSQLSFDYTDHPPMVTPDSAAMVVSEGPTNPSRWNRRLRWYGPRSISSDRRASFLLASVEESGSELVGVDVGAGAPGQVGAVTNRAGMNGYWTEPGVGGGVETVMTIAAGGTVVQCNERQGGAVTTIEFRKGLTGTAVDIQQMFPGEIRMFITTALPPRWLPCDGTAVPNAQTLYPELWAVAPASWKVGSTLTPWDMRDRVPRGSATPGVLDGSDTSTIAAGHLPPHVHRIDHTHPAGVTGAGGAHAHLYAQRQSSLPGGTASAMAANASGALVTASTGTEPAHTHPTPALAITGNSGNGPGSSTPLDTTQAAARVVFAIYGGVV